MDKKVTLNIKNYEKLKKEAEKRGITITSLVNLLIFNFLKDIEK